MGVMKIAVFRVPMDVNLFTSLECQPVQLVTSRKMQSVDIICKNLACGRDMMKNADCTNSLFNLL